MLWIRLAGVIFSKAPRSKTVISSKLALKFPLRQIDIHPGQLRRPARKEKNPAHRLQQLAPRTSCAWPFIIAVRGPGVLYLPNPVVVASVWQDARVTFYDSKQYHRNPHVNFPQNHLPKPLYHKYLMTNQKYFSSSQPDPPTRVDVGRLIL